MNQVNIIETAQWWIGDEAIGIGNIFRSSYKLPDGTMKKGLTVTLFYREKSEVVGQGTIIEVDDEKWLVTSIKQPWFFGRGNVTFEKVK